MRIFGTSGISQWISNRSNKINERAELDSDSQRQDSQQYTQADKQKKDQNGGNEKDQPTFEEVKNKVNEFETDANLKASGLQAEIVQEESGNTIDRPGLRVVVKDKQGNVLRQLTGDEFLKLRDTQSTKESPVGKLIDRKY